MQTIDLLVFPKWLVTIEPEGQALEEHAMAVDGGRIIDILSQDDFRAASA